MANYKPLYTLYIEHDYYENKNCRAIQCVVSPSNAAFLRRRGLILRQTRINAWEILYDQEGGGIDTDSDLLLLDLHQTDSLFVLTTQWDDFKPNSAYMLELPAATEILDAALSIKEINTSRAINSAFVQIRLRLTEDILQKAQANQPAGCTLQFHAPKHNWEYLIFMRDNKWGDSDSNLRIEDQSGQLHFSQYNVVDECGVRALSVVSEESVQMYENHAYQLYITYTKVDGGQKKLRIANIPTPKPGQFLSNNAKQLRQIYYI